jgi:hypothetical protein
MWKGIVGNKRNAEMNVVKVKPQSRKNCEVNSGEPGVGEESAAMGCLSGRLFCVNWHRGWWCGLRAKHGCQAGCEQEPFRKSSLHETFSFAVSTMISRPTILEGNLKLKSRSEVRSAKVEV